MADMSVGSGLDRRLAPERTTHVRAVIAEAHGGPEVLRLAEHDSLQPGPGQLLVDVTTAGVNYMDIYQREGRPPYRGDVPFVLGSEGAGTVAAMGPDAPGVRQGDRVAWTGISGCYAEQVIIPADRAVQVPEEIDLETAGAVMLQGMPPGVLACCSRRWSRCAAAS
jgi:NADPH2:quinone reductase